MFVRVKLRVRVRVRVRVGISFIPQITQDTQ